MTVRDPVYVFLHMPKCAGTTFRVHIENNLRPEEILGLYVNRDEKYRERDYVRSMIEEWPQKKRENLKVIYGHEVHYGIHDWLGREARYFTFLRDPVARTVSWYNYRRQKDLLDRHVARDAGDRDEVPTLEDWIDCSPWVWNEMMGYLADFGYCERQNSYDPTEVEFILDKFFFVGLTEKFDEDALFLYSLLGIRKKFFRSQNISRRYAEGDTEKTRRKIRAKNRFDMLLYERSVMRREAAVKALGGYRSRVRRMKARRQILRVLASLSGGRRAG